MSKVKQRKQNKNPKSYVAVGGQALMEGVMMTGPSGTAVALRMPDNSIQTEMKTFRRIRDRFKPFAFPFIRGIVNMIESQVFGYKCLMESAEKTTIQQPDADEELSGLDKWLNDHFGPKMMTVIGVVAMILGLAAALLLFVVTPTLLFEQADKWIAADLVRYKALLEGVVKVLLFVSYMWAVSLMKDIKRVFQYHGAEHKSIFCFENKLELTVENVRKQRRFHPRCGTSFLFLTVLISILFSALTLSLFPQLSAPENKILWVCVKLLLLPVIMGVGYECIMLAGKYQNWLTRVLTAPGLWMQRITTKEPDDAMIEVAVAALKASLGIGEEPVTSTDAEISVQEEVTGHELPQTEDPKPVLQPEGITQEKPKPGSSPT